MLLDADVEITQKPHYMQHQKNFTTNVRMFPDVAITVIDSYFHVVIMWHDVALLLKGSTCCNTSHRLYISFIRSYRLDIMYLYGYSLKRHLRRNYNI